MAEWHNTKEWKTARANAKKVLAPICSYCNKELIGADFTIDHVIPPSKLPGGIPDHSLDNLQALCRSCNGRKQDNTQVRVTYRNARYYE